MVWDVREVRRRRPLRQDVPRLRRQGPDAQHARHARQEGHHARSSVVLILCLRQPLDGRPHRMAVLQARLA